MSYENLFNLTDKIALIVGAAGGLAGETSLGLAQFGATLALADIDNEGLKNVCNDLRKRGSRPCLKLSMYQMRLLL